MDSGLQHELLGRREDQFDLGAKFWRGRTVLVTGAAGYIGSELCRRVAQCGARLVLGVDRAEAGLLALMGEPSVQPELADVRDGERLREILDKTRPSVIFHAAAFKHVALLEQFPIETIKNNTLASLHLLEMAREFEVERFVFISTDKAVKPASIMGASKRLAEMLLGAAGNGLSLRCGNVLGSSGSVLPIWLKEIRRGGPLTLTAPEAERFFVSLSESTGALLALASGEEGRGLFTYNLHEAISMGNLARCLMKFAGTVEVTTCGLRPGEKVREQLLGNGEWLVASSCSHVSRVEARSIFGDACELVERLERSCAARNAAELLQVVRKYVPEYVPSSILYKV